MWPPILQRTKGIDFFIYQSSDCFVLFFMDFSDKTGFLKGTVVRIIRRNILNYTMSDLNVSEPSTIQQVNYKI